MRINYVDPALFGRSGHHFQWFARIAHELVARGHEVRAYVHQRADAATLEAVSRHAKPVPLFVSSPYARPEKIDPVCGELALFMADMHHLPAALRRIGPADAWVWPTLFASQLPALAAANVRVPVAACIHWGPDRFQQLGASVWRYGALTAAKAGIKLRIALALDELVPLYQPLLGQALPVLPIPVDAGPPAPLRSRMQTIGFFGEQRARKGSELLPQLVGDLLKQGFKVVVQDSSGRAVSHGGHPNLQVLGYVSSLPDEMARCDLVVAPYDPVPYRHMASGIVWEAISRGIPVVAPRGTCPGNYLEQLGAGTTFATYDAQGILSAIGDAGARYPDIRQAAHRACEAWPRRHGVGAYVSGLLDGTLPERAPDARPPITVCS